MSITAPIVVLLEDDAADAHLIREVLRRQLPEADVQHAATRREYLDLLDGDTRSVDVVLSDGTVPGCEGVEAYYLAREHQPIDRDVAFIFVSGSAEPADLRGLQALGVSDFVAKDALDGLGPAIRSALAHGQHASGGGSAQDRKLLAGYQVLVQTAAELSGARDLPAIMAIACSAARRLTGAEGAAFVLREGDLCHYADEDAVSRLWQGQRYPMTACLSGWSMNHRQPAVVDDIYTDHRLDRWNREPYLDTFVRSAVVVPIRAADPTGAIGTYWAQPHRPDAIEVRLLQALADTTAATMANVEVHRELETRVRERTEELEAFTYAVSHDLRAPIRHLEGFARILLQDNEDLPESARANAERIQRAAVHLRDMVTGLVGLSRTTRSDVHRQSVDLAELAREVVRELDAAHEHDVDFVCPASIPVNGDPRLIRSALEHLLGNAWKFTAHTLQPTVELGAEPGPGFAENGGEPVYFVQDNGAGFEPASAERAFVAFQRLHSESDYPGTGVGLAAVKRIITKHGGTIRANGAPGRGARFSFTLPS